VDRVEGDSLEREEVEEGWGWGGVFPLPELHAEELPLQVSIFYPIYHPECRKICVHKLRGRLFASKESVLAFKSEIGSIEGVGWL